MEHSAVPARLIAKIVLVAAAVFALLYLLYVVRSVLLLLVIGVFLALAVAPVVNLLDRWRYLPRWGAILLVYLGIGAAVFGVGLVLVPPLVEGVDRLSQDLPGYVEDLRANETLREYDDRYGFIGELQEQARELPSHLGAAAGTLADVTVGVFASFLQLFLILVIAFFLLIDGGRISEFVFAQLSPDRERRARTVAADIAIAVRGYVAGNFVISVLAGLVTYTTLSLLDVPGALPLALLFAFLDLVPLVGATVGGLLVGLVVAFVDFPTSLIIWGVVFIVYQQIENNLIQPYVYGRTVQVHPLVVIVAVLIGAALLGILGALLALPVAAAVQSVVRDWWRFSHGAEARAASSAPPEPAPQPGTA